MSLIYFPDRGDGRWKKKDRETLQDDIALFREMADKIQHEMEEFYDEYPDEKLTKNDIDKIYGRYLRMGRLEITKHHLRIKEMIKNDTIKTAWNNPAHETELRNDSRTLPINDKAVDSKNKYYFKYNSWPKFEDILLEMGKKYDWKNDRWIKVKRKLDNVNVERMNDNSIDVHVKHKFFYRIVKLKKSKNQRNVVVAVSAVR
ncbi:unnamed protein product [Diatraea saccharalis]|uniref:Uncharacterized protein n=1 Tax=Diatraea saccharalis TaxID=40085 RepID=A0A9P0FXV7_9NEOP|nr:unnamed protein product [Diatraea saccharalis]